MGVIKNNMLNNLDMKRTIVLFIFILVFAQTKIYGQLNTGTAPKSFVLKDLKMTEPLSFSINVDEYLAKYPSRNDSSLLVAIPIIIEMDFIKSSTLTHSDKKGKIYQMSFYSKDATALGIYFSIFYLPKGYELHVFNSNKTETLGAFTFLNNNSNKKFAITPLTGESLTLELYEPFLPLSEEIPAVVISKISHHFRDYPQTFSGKNFRPKSVTIDGQNCYLDVECEINDGRERGVFLWEFEDLSDNNFYVCSGSLLNQDVSANNLKPLAYTANHCGKDADLSTATFRFNFQNKECNLTSTAPNYTLSGAVFRASKSLSDMFLMELSEIPPPDYNVNYLGWDRSDRGDLSDYVKGIHHAEGGKKAVSTGSFQANTNPYFWRVRWDVNNHPTSQGSSGSPLMSSNTHKVIGDLSYGVAQCDNLTGIDRYGKLRAQWNDPFGSTYKKTG